MRKKFGTIGYCDEKIKAIKASNRPRVQKIALIEEWEDKKQDIRNGIFDRRSTRLRPAEIELLEAREVIRALRHENKELRHLLGITKNTEITDDMYESFVHQIKMMECTITNVNGVYKRRHELLEPFNKWPRRKLEELTWQMVRHMKLYRHPETGILS